MPEGVSRSQLAVYAAIAVAVVLLGARYLRGSSPAPAPPAAAPVRVEDGGGSRGGSFATVHVAGAVRRPGVYRLKPGSRVDDALRLAGGPTRRADLSAVNLAAKVEDGRQILVPVRAPRGSPAATPGTAPPGAPAQPISLNTATLEQLDQLPGVGPVTAQRILEWRSQNGRFGAVDQLQEVSGIGEARFATLRDLVTV